MKTPEEHLRAFWDFYCTHSEIDNQPEVIEILEHAFNAIREARAEGMEDAAKIVGSAQASDSDLIAYDDNGKANAWNTALLIAERIRAAAYEEGEEVSENRDMNIAMLEECRRTGRREIAALESKLAVAVEALEYIEHGFGRIGQRATGVLDREAVMAAARDALSKINEVGKAEK